MRHIYTPVLVPRPHLFIFFVVNLYYKKEVVCVQEQYTPTILEEYGSYLWNHVHIGTISCKYHPIISFFYLIYIE